MPSRRHSSAIVSSPRNPSSTMRIFSSAEYCLRVARRMSLIALAAPVWRVSDFCLIFVPFGHYDETETLPYAIQLVCSIGADVRQIRFTPFRYFFFRFSKLATHSRARRCALEMSVGIICLAIMSRRLEARLSPLAAARLSHMYESAKSLGTPCPE